MDNQMLNKSICIIPARGGSKRIPKKNIKDFFDKPLIAYSIEVALESQLFKSIVVSTDDKAIKKVALQYGAEVIDRPIELADDFTGTQDVIDHAIQSLKEQGEEFDYVCTLYATAPLLQSKYLIEGFVKMMNNEDGFIGPVNMGNPDEFTIKELAEKVIELIPKTKSRIIYKDLPQDDPKRRKPDISLAKEKLNWQPKVKLDKGLKKTIKYFENVI